MCNIITVGNRTDRTHLQKSIYKVSEFTILIFVVLVVFSLSYPSLKMSTPQPACCVHLSYNSTTKSYCSYFPNPLPTLCQITFEDTLSQSSFLTVFLSSVFNFPSSCPHRSTDAWLNGKAWGCFMGGPRVKASQSLCQLLF